MKLVNARSPSAAGTLPPSPLSAPPHPMRSRTALASLLLSACAAPARPAVVAPAPAPVVACRFDGADVSFARPLTLLHALPPPGALAEYPFAELRRASAVRVTVLAGDAARTPVHVTVETAMVRLDAVAHAAELPLFPARASTFAGLVTPLAHHPLRWTDATPGALRLALAPIRRVSLDAPPEERPCEHLRLRPVAPFEALPPAARPRVALAPGRWILHASAGPASGPTAALDLLAGDAVWLLEEGPARWARVLWTSDNAALVGWVDRGHAVRPDLGHGGGTGTGHRVAARCDGARRCASEVPLRVDDRGVTRAVGHLLRGAAVLVGAASGGLTRVTVCDPDVDWADGVAVLVPSDRAAVCAPSP